MPHFNIYTADNAPEGSRPALRALKEAFGFVPNTAGAIAGYPPLLNAFVTAFKSAHSGSFSEAEVQVILLTNAVTNACAWAVAFHTRLALQQGIAPADVDAIRRREAPAGPRIAALSALARGLIEGRGHVDEARLRSFVDAGFSPAQVLEVVLVVSASTIANYVGTLARPPLEDALQPHAWIG